MADIDFAFGNKYKAEWGTIKYQADPQKVAEEIESIGMNFTAQDVVDYAADHPEGETHKCLEWRDRIAANEYRKSQVRSMLGNLKITILRPDEPPKKTQIRVFSMPSNRGKYMLTQVIVKDTDKLEQLFAMAKSELTRFRNKYDMLSGELPELFDLIDTL